MTNTTIPFGSRIDTATQDVELPYESIEEPATLEEWEAIPKIPGYRFIDGWWHNSLGRSNAPPVPMTERQLKILAGVIPIVG